MPATVVDDPVLHRIREALDSMYGDEIERVVLFGSRARGGARDDSDYDVAVFLRSLPDRWAELDRLAALRVRLIDDTGAFIDAKPYPAGAYRERTALMYEIRQDGIDL
jgi:predicted nucleotidyltransferase